MLEDTDMSVLPQQVAEDFQSLQKPALTRAKVDAVACYCFLQQSGTLSDYRLQLKQSTCRVD
jgi:hypothetical protein